MLSMIPISGLVDFLLFAFSSVSFSVFFFDFPDFFLVVFVVFSVVFFFGLPGPLFLVSFLSAVSVVFFFGLPAFRFFFFSGSFSFFGLPGPRFLGGSCFSRMVVVCLLSSSLSLSVVFFFGLPRFLGFLSSFLTFLFFVVFLVFFSSSSSSSSSSVFSSSVIVSSTGGFSSSFFLSSFNLFDVFLGLPYFRFLLSMPAVFSSSFLYFLVVNILFLQRLFF